MPRGCMGACVLRCSEATVEWPALGPPGRSGVAKVVGLARFQPRAEHAPRACAGRGAPLLVSPSGPQGLPGASQLWIVCSEMGKGRAKHPGHWVVHSRAMDCSVSFGPFLKIFLQSIHVINFPSQFCWAWAVKVSLYSLSTGLVRWSKSRVAG